MKRKQLDAADARKVLMAMILDDVVCSRIASQWQPGGLFDSRPLDLVAGWCVKHNEKYGESFAVKKENLTGLDISGIPMESVHNQLRSIRESSQNLPFSTQRTLTTISNIF